MSVMDGSGEPSLDAGMQPPLHGDRVPRGMLARSLGSASRDMRPGRAGGGGEEMRDEGKDRVIPGLCHKEAAEAQD